VLLWKGYKGLCQQPSSKDFDFEPGPLTCYEIDLGQQIASKRYDECAIAACAQFLDGEYLMVGRGYNNAPPLNYALKNNDAKMVSFLLAMNASPNAKDNN
jgi:ankyrin repeat protein